MPASTYRHKGDHIPVATASAGLTGGTLAWQEGFFGVVITGCDSGASTELDVAGVHDIAVPASTVKGDRLWADLSSDSATIVLVRSGMTAGMRLIGEAVTSRDGTTGKALVKLAHQPTTTYPDAGVQDLSVITTVTPGTAAGSKAVVLDANKDIAGIRDVGVRNLDAGASGTAGTVDIFPTTGSKGKASISVTDQTGDTTVGLVIGAMAAARTITLADPLANADILTGKMGAVARTATADGTTTGTIADAGLLQFVTVTSDNADKIVILPTPTPGRIVLLANGATGYELRSSDPATIAINGGTGAGAESAIAASTLVVAVCKSATAWAAFSLAGVTLAAVEQAA